VRIRYRHRTEYRILCGDIKLPRPLPFPSLEDYERLPLLKALLLVLGGHDAR
jgi:hypothetical protein